MKASTRMGVTVTLVFADELHREAWLIEEGMIAQVLPEKSDDGTYNLGIGLQQKLLAKRLDYERRRDNTDLVYEVGPVSSKTCTR